MTTNVQPITLQKLLEQGVHFGHQKKRWNPKMKPYIYTKRGDIHIIDLSQTLSCMKKAFEFVQTLIENNKTILFVGTKKQARQIIQEQAKRAGLPYVNARWLGGTFTNFDTIKKSIQRLNRLEERKNSADSAKLTKKEKSLLEKQLQKLLLNLAGIRELKKLPDAVFITDTNRDYIAVEEAVKTHIPIIAIVDTNSNPTHITYPIPANDDAIKSLSYIITSLADFITLLKQKKAANTLTAANKS